MKILIIEVIEDEESYLKLVHNELTAIGYKVVDAKEGKQGLDIAKLEHPDLILLDLKLPGIDGMTVLNELRQDDWGKTAKVIILTNLEPDDAIMQGIVKNQPAYYILKSDIKLEGLIEKIKEVLPQTVEAKEGS